MGFAKNERILGFEDYDIARQPKQVTATTKALRLASGWSEGKHRTVVLSGPIGVGKTHLAKAAVYAAGLGNLRSHFVSAADFEGRCKSFDLPDDVRRRGMQGLVEVDRLAFDDLGSGALHEKGGVSAATPFMAAQLETLFDGRYRRGLGAFVTTNLKRDEFAEYAGVRVLDRLMEGGQWLYMQGVSLRRGASD